MRYYLIAGEASGDLHGSNLIKALHSYDPQAAFRCWGGDLMGSAGAEVVKHYRDLAFMGFWEVFRNIRTILKNLDFCKKDILAWQPDTLILIDYPGFNLKLAKWAKSNGFKVLYYISPQIWAWHQSRVKQIQSNVDQIYVILPFEREFYKKRGVHAEFVGHPLLDAIQSFDPNPVFRAQWSLSEKPIIALLPGSRRQEIRHMLPVMIQIARDFPGYQFVVGMAPSQTPEFYKPFIRDALSQIGLVRNDTYQLLFHSKAALVASGTATLETALFGVPQVVCYKGNPFSFWVAKHLVKVKYISLVNLIADEQIVTELIQQELNVVNLKSELELILTPGHSEKIKGAYYRLVAKLGTSGASKRAAQLMYEYLNQKPE